MSSTFERKINLNETTRISNSSLKDINWRVKMVMSSDKFANIKEPIAVVEFQIDTENGVKTTCLEMTKDELKEFLNSLETANKAVNQLKS